MIYTISIKYSHDRKQEKGKKKPMLGPLLYLERENKEKRKKSSKKSPYINVDTS